MNGILEIQNAIQVLSSRTLFLTNEDRNGLYITPNKTGHVIVNINKNFVSVREVTNSGCFRINISLNMITKKYFNLHEHSVFQYLVTPEMEVERIFNTLRFKYLRAIYLSGIPNPQTHLHYRFNKAFQTLAGIKVYQGNSHKRKTNDSFWQEAGFTFEARNQNWEKESNDLQTLLSLIKRHINGNQITRLYAELIAIKPGFHELYLHDDYFDAETIPIGSSPRDQIFRMLRNKGKLSSLTLDEFPKEINKKDYLSYAPCNVTEGPFVFRKNINVSYFDEIRCIRTKKQVGTLKDKFHILDYCRTKLSTRKRLENFLQKAESFCRYPPAEF